MLRAHSLLWYYLWVAPNLFLLVLAVLIWRRNLYKQFPVFLLYAVVVAVEQLTLCLADVLPSISPTSWWYLFWAGLLAEAVVKFALIGEIFSRVCGLYPSLAKLGKSLISGVGVVLVLLASLAAAYTPKDNIHWIVSGAHLLEQTTYMIECGLILFLFLFAAYFKLHWSRSSFGIALGLGTLASVELATSAIWLHLGAFGNRAVDLCTMATYHCCVLIWIFYLVRPERVKSQAVNPLPQHNLDIWNRELQHLLQR